MTEEASTEAPATDGQQIAEAVPSAIETEKQEKNDYQGRVDLNELPEEYRKPIEARISTLTKKMGNQYRQLTGDIKTRDELLREQSLVIEEMRSNMGKVVDHLHSKSITEEENAAKQALRDAHQTGDTEAFVSANERLANVAARKLSIANQPKPQKQETKPNGQQQYRSAGDIADDAVNDGEMDPVMGETVKAWQGETDERGAPLRPWAQSRTPNEPLNDPIYRRAYLESAVVFDEDGPFAHMTVEQKLAEVDRRMGTQRNQGGQNVMGGGNLTTNKKSAKITLTPEAQRIATRFKFAGPKASEAEHLEAYRKQIEKVRSTKGAR